MQHHVKKIVDHIWGPVGSVILHILIVILLVKLVVFIQEEKDRQIEAEVMEIEEVDIEDLLEPEPPEEIEEVPDHVVPPDVTLEVEQPDVQEFESTEPDMDFEALDIVADFKSPLKLKGLYQGRGGAGRAKALKLFGGSIETERAVIAALEWLKRNQKPDGTWEPTDRAPMKDEMSIALTGLGLLAFLAHGETPASEEYGETVQKAIRFLVNIQSDDGHFAFPDKDSQKSPYKANTYAQAIAVYALAEAYGMTQVPALRTAVEKGVQHIMDGQQARGGWDYRYDKGSHFTASVSGWQAQAVKAAYIAGARNEGIEETIKKAINFFKANQDPESGLFRYSDGSRRDANVTGISILCLQLMGEGGSSEVRDGLKAINDFQCQWDAPPSWSICCWYYITQAKFHRGGSTWSSWNKKFAPEFVRMQNKDGSWTSPAKSGAPVPFGIEEPFGPAYATALAALTLQVYYRFLPTYQKEATESVIQEEVEEDDDIEIEII